MTIEVSTADPRSLKALAILDTSSRWLKCRTVHGKKVYAVPSQTRHGAYYLTDGNRCDCPDFARRDQLCKHAVAVRLYVARSWSAKTPARTTRRAASRPCARGCGALVAPEALSNTCEDCHGERLTYDALFPPDADYANG